jgi:hypothetical protein
VHIRKRGERIAKEAHRQSAIRSDVSSPSRPAASGLPTVKEDHVRSSSPTMGRAEPDLPDVLAVSNAANATRWGERVLRAAFTADWHPDPTIHFSSRLGERETAKLLSRESQQPYVSWSHFLVC